MAPAATKNKKITGSPGPTTTKKPPAMSKPPAGSGKNGAGKPAGKKK